MLSYSELTPLLRGCGDVGLAGTTGGVCWLMTGGGGADLGLLASYQHNSYHHVSFNLYNKSMVIYITVLF